MTINKLRSAILGSIFLTIGSSLLAIAVGEGAARIIFPEWRDFDSSRFIGATERVPGHGFVPIGRAGFDGSFAQNNGDFHTRVSINNMGLREDKPITNAHEQIWVVGDSFAFGWGVESSERFSAIIAKQSKEAVYNIASPGTGICGYQALIARMPKNISPKALVVSLTMENDLSRIDCAETEKLAETQSALVNANPPISFFVAKRWLTAHSAFYNFAVTSLKRSEALVSLGIRLGLIRPTVLAHRARTSASFEQLVERSSAELLRIRTLVSPRASLFFLIIPSRQELLQNNIQETMLRQAIKGKLSDGGAHIIDPTDRLVQEGVGDMYFKHDGHWTKRAHAIAGEMVANIIQKVESIKRDD